VNEKAGWKRLTTVGNENAAIKQQLDCAGCCASEADAVRQCELRLWGWCRVIVASDWSGVWMHMKKGHDSDTFQEK
jgi:hypothetical protein